MPAVEGASGRPECFLSAGRRGNASFYLTFTLNPALTSFVLHPKLSLVLLQYDFRVAFLSPARGKFEESFSKNVKGAHLAGYFLGVFFDAGTSAVLGGFSAKLTFRLWPVKISGKS